MNKESMKNLIKEEITKRLGNNFHISIQEVLKTNVKRDGLTILEEGTNISPTIYLEAYYKRLLNGEDISIITDEILALYEKAKLDSNQSSFDVSFVTDFQQIKGKLFVKLINRHLNKELLSDVPFAYFLDDFAIVPYVVVNMLEEGTASFRVHNCHIEMWGVEPNELIDLAIKNTRELFGVEIKSMKDVLFGMGELDNLPFPEVFNPPMYVATNTTKLNGATIALFDDELKAFAKEHGNFYVIFSSVHECLFIPDDYNMNLDELTSMNVEVNATQVACDEVLGTKAYFYDEEKGFVIK